MGLIEFKHENATGLMLQGTLKSAPAIVLFHGYGANCDDLAPLSDYLGLSDEITWYFPDGYVEIPTSPMMTGKAWFEIDLKYFISPPKDLQEWALSDKMRQSFEAASLKVNQWLKFLKTSHNQIILGGFSQGSIIACDQAFFHGFIPQSLLILSGALIPKERWFKNNTKITFPVFQSHGKQDPVLTYSTGKALAEQLKAKTPHSNFYPFDGGHEIPPATLNQLKKFLEDQTK